MWTVVGYWLLAAGYWLLALVRRETVVGVRLRMMSLLLSARIFRHAVLYNWCVRFIRLSPQDLVCDRPYPGFRKLHPGATISKPPGNLVQRLQQTIRRESCVHWAFNVSRCKRSSRIIFMHFPSRTDANAANEVLLMISNRSITPAREAR